MTQFDRKLLHGLVDSQVQSEEEAASQVSEQSVNESNAKKDKRVEQALQIRRRNAISERK